MAVKKKTISKKKPRTLLKIRLSPIGQVKAASLNKRAQEYVSTAFSSGGLKRFPKDITPLEEKLCVEVLANVEPKRRSLLIKASIHLRDRHRRMANALVK